MIFNRKKQGQKMLTSLLCLILFVENINFPYIQVQAGELMSEQEGVVTDEELDSDMFDDDSEVILSEEENTQEDEKVREEESRVEKNDGTEDKESFTDENEGIQEESYISEEKESENILKISVSESDIASGSYKDITWVIDAYGKLMIEGTGEISYNAGGGRAPWHSYVNDIKVAIVNVENISDASCMFYDCENLTSVDLSNFDTTEVTNISGMFYNCKNLKNVKFGNFNVHSAVGLTDVSNLFCNCTNLESVNLSGLNISSATNMSCMFYRCSSLMDIRFDKINTNQVTNMSSMFSGCHSLTNLDVSDFDTSQVTNMYGMFSSCDSLTNLDVSNFDTSQVINMSNMFSSCSSLISLDLSKLNTVNVTNMSSMFRGCDSLTNLDISSFDTGQVTNMFSMFSDCGSLTNLDVSSFNTSQVTNMSSMFCNCNNLTNLDLSSFNTNQVTNMSSMFCNCNNLISVDVSSFDTNQVTNMSSMFSSCNNLTNLDVSNFNTSQVISMEHMFINCRNISDLNVSNFDTNQVTNMSGMFSGCSNLTNIDVSSFNTGQVTNMESMFNGCDSLTNLDVSSFDTSQVTNMESMFSSCGSLTNLNVSNFDTSSVTNMVGMFSGCSSLTNLDLTNFYTSNVTNMSFMFSLCENLINVDISNFDTSNVTNMESMFYICRSLTSIDLSSFNTYNVSDMSDMFYLCRSLTRIDISNFDVSNVIRMTFIFSGCDNLTVINTPLNLKLSVTLPAELGDIWILSDETEITELPQNLSYSVEIIKNKSSIGSGDNIASGSYKDITWVIDANGKLTVEGTGDFSDSTDFDRAPWSEYRNSIKSAEISVTGMTNASYMFSNCENLESINFSNFDTSRVINMEEMFIGCSALTRLDLSSFNTSNVTNMTCMFTFCSSLTDLNLSSFDTSNVTDMCESKMGMFSGCSSLIDLNVSNFDTKNITSMRWMFSDCSSLENLNIDGFDFINVDDAGGMFSMCSNLERIDLSNIYNTDNIRILDYMFSDCTKLESLDLQDFDSSNVEHMHSMFENCSNLNSLSLFHKTSNVRDMSNMFSGCSSLTHLYLGSLNTSKVKYMTAMFKNCSSLISIDVSNFDTSNVCDMSNMFSGCDGLKILDLSSFNVENVKESSVVGSRYDGMKGMLDECNNLVVIYTPYNVPSNLTNPAKLPALLGNTWYQPDKTAITELPKNLSYSIEIVKNATDSEYIANGISGDITWRIDINGKLTVEGTGDFADYISSSYRKPWYEYRSFIKSAEVNAAGITDASYMFYKCNNLINLDLSNFDTSQVTTMESMFYECNNLTNLDLSNFDTSQVTTMRQMFCYCNNIKNLDLSNFNTSQVIDMSDMFSFCTNLESLNLNSFNTSQVITMQDMFWSCSSLKSLDLSNFDTSQVISMEAMFSECDNLIDLDLKSFDTSQVTTMNMMFHECSNLSTLDLGSFNTSRVINMMNMFNGCNNLKSLDLSNFDTSQVTDIDTMWGMYSMFRDCNSLENLDLSNFNTSRVTTMESMFNGCSSLKKLDLSNFDTSQVTNMNYMFQSCNSLENLDLNSFDTSQVTSMHYMFVSCKSLNNLNLNNFNTSQVTDMSDMFSNCNNLTSLDLSSFNTNQVTDMSFMFSECNNLTSLDLSNFNISQITDVSGMFSGGCNSLSIVKTPYKLNVSVVLPKLSGDIWYQPDGTEITELPKNLGYSITITKNKKPTTATPYITATKIKTSYECGDTLNINDITVKYCDATGAVTTITDYTTNADKIDMSTPGKKILVITYKNMTANVELTVISKTSTDNIASGNYGNIKWSIDKNGKLTVEGTGEIYDSNYQIPWNAYCDSIQSAVINVKNITNTAFMFNGCKNIINIDLSGLNTDYVTNMEGMFSECSALASLDLSNLNIANVTNMSNLFSGCSNLTTIYTPCNIPANLTAIAALPAASNDAWYQPDGTTITELPKNLSYSIIITKSKAPITIEPYITVTKIKTTYQCGDALNIEDITVKYCDAAGIVTTITDYATNADKVDMSTPGKKTLEITYNNLQAVIELTVTEKKEDINPDDPENPEKNGLKVNLKYGENYIYTGKAIKPEVVVTYNGVTVREGIDYTIKYSNNINANTTASSKDKMPKVIVTGKGNWNGSDSVSFAILPADIQNVIIGGSSKDENGEEILTVVEGAKKTNPALYYGDLKINSKNYTIIEKAGDGYSSKDNGKTITIKANINGNFTGTRTLKVNVINKSKLKKFTVSVDSKELIYDGTNQKNKIDFVVYDKADNSINLEEGKDYVVSWSGDTTNAGKVKFTIIGLGLYSGTNVTKTCTILPIKAEESEMIVSGIDESGYDFVSTGVTIDNLNVTYKGTILVKGRDYKVSYGNNKKAGIAKYTVSFLGNYKGSAAKKGTFLIQKAVFGENSGDELKVMIADKVYNGKPGTYKSTPYVILNGIALKASDYVVSYYTDAGCTEPVSSANKIELWKDNDAATIYVKIETTDKSSYSGSVSTSYQVRNGSDLIDLSGAKIIIDKKMVSYTGNACTNTLKVFCKNGTGWRRIYENIDFKVTYANNINKGKATVIITGMDGSNYIGTKTASFNIVAQKVNLK